MAAAEALASFPHPEEFVARGSRTRSVAANVAARCGTFFSLRPSPSKRENSDDTDSKYAIASGSSFAAFHQANGGRS